MRFEQFRIGVADWLRLIDPGIIDQPVKPAQLFAMGDDLVPVSHIRHVEPPEARATTEAYGKLQALLLAHIAEDDPRALLDQTSGFRRALTSRCAADKYDFVLKATHLNLLSRPTRCLSLRRSPGRHLSKTPARVSPQSQGFHGAADVFLAAEQATQF